MQQGNTWALEKEIKYWENQRRANTFHQWLRILIMADSSSWGEYWLYWLPDMWPMRYYFAFLSLSFLNHKVRIISRYFKKVYGSRTKICLPWCKKVFRIHSCKRSIKKSWKMYIMKETMHELATLLRSIIRIRWRLETEEKFMLRHCYFSINIYSMNTLRVQPWSERKVNFLFVNTLCIWTHSSISSITACLHLAAWNRMIQWLNKRKRRMKGKTAEESFWQGTRKISFLEELYVSFQCLIIMAETEKEILQIDEGE